MEKLLNWKHSALFISGIFAISSVASFPSSSKFLEQTNELHDLAHFFVNLSFASTEIFLSFKLSTSLFIALNIILLVPALPWWVHATRNAALWTCHNPVLFTAILAAISAERGVIRSIPSNRLISTEIKKWRVCRALFLDDVFLLAETISWRALIFGNGSDISGETSCTTPTAKAVLESPSVSVSLT